MKSTNNETLEIDSYARLYAQIRFYHATSEENLKLLELRAKTFLVSTNREEALNLQLKINAEKAFLEKLKAYLIEVDTKLYNIAKTFNRKECEIFSLMFFRGLSCQQIADKYNYAQSSVSNMKSKWLVLIKEYMENENNNQ